MAVEIGGSIGHYKIVSKIGSGGMGEVYLAGDTKLERRVAIKFLHEELSKDADALTVHIDKRADGEVFYAVRVGDRLDPRDNNLATQEEMLVRLDVRLAEAQRPPEVRIACHRELPRGLVRDVARELGLAPQRGHRRQPQGDPRGRFHDGAERRQRR